MSIKIVKDLTLPTAGRHVHKWFPIRTEMICYVTEVFFLLDIELRFTYTYW
jgi:hypothetical protein